MRRSLEKKEKKKIGGKNWRKEERITFKKKIIPEVNYITVKLEQRRNLSNWEKKLKVHQKMDQENVCIEHKENQNNFMILYREWNSQLISRTNQKMVIEKIK